MSPLRMSVQSGVMYVNGSSNIDAAAICPHVSIVHTERLSDITGELKVLNLILAYRDLGRSTIRSEII